MVTKRLGALIVAMGSDNLRFTAWFCLSFLSLWVDSVVLILGRDTNIRVWAGQARTTHGPVEEK